MKKGFTLAEVLITLGIIGVVAAMTIPTLIAKYEKQQTLSHLKKVYSTMAQAFTLSQVENGEFSRWNLNSTSNPKDYVMTYWVPYLKVSKFCDTYSDCGYDKMRPFVHIDGTVSSEDVTSPDSIRYAIVLSDGTMVSFRIPPTSVNNGNGTAKITIDLNGYKGPNMSGKDYFWFEIKNNKLAPFENGTDDCNNEVKGGATCFAKIVNDGWQIKDDYPW